MLLERIENNRITISFSPRTDVFGIQRLIEYAKYLEATSDSKAQQADVDRLADDVSSSWWAKNRSRFLQ